VIVRKKTILLMSLLSIGLSIVGFIVFFAAGAAAIANNCTSEQIQNGTCTVSSSAANAGLGIGALIGLLILIVAGIIGLIAWIGGLIRSAKMQTWGWFVAVLLLGGLGTLIYGIAGPSDQPAMVGGYYPPSPPPYYPPR
jgi:hypothetical protein